MNSITSRRTRLTYRVLSAFIAFTFSFTSVIPPSYAQSIASLNLPVPGAMVGPSAAFVPVLLKGMTIHPDNPLQFDFIIDSGNTNFKEDQIRTESERLVKYFLASMTIPKDDLWVNLSPYESDKIIPEALGKTELGRDMLAQDYILKQLTASLMYPEKELGKEFWDKVYKKAQEKYGTTEIPVDTFNKVWILPETATVYEHGQTVYIVDAKLKVMLDSDYLAMSHNVTKSQGHQEAVAGDMVTATEGSPQQGSDPVTTQIVRDLVVPAIEKEVNEGQNFAPLRQIYHSLILAKWYKETIKNSLLSKVYVDKKLINGIRLEDGQLKREDGSIIDFQSSIVDQIYNQYMEAYKKGVFNYIKEDYDRLSNEVIPRKYFSGGIKGDVQITKSSSPTISSIGRIFMTAVLVTCMGGGCTNLNTAAISKNWINNTQHQNRSNMKNVYASDKNREIVENLRSDNFLKRISALEELDEMGSEAGFAIPGLIVSLTDETLRVRNFAAKILRKLHWEPQAQNQQEIFSIADKSLEDLIATGSKAVPILINDLKHERQTWPEEFGDSRYPLTSPTAEALAKIGGPAVLNLVDLWRQGGVESVYAEEALEKIASSKDPTAVEPFTRVFLEEEHYIIKDLAKKALQDMWPQSKSATQPIINAFLNGDLRAGWIFYYAKEISDEMAKKILDNATSGFLKSIFSNTTPLDEYRRLFFDINPQTLVSILEENGSLAAQKLSMLVATSTSNDSSTTDKELHSYVGAKYDYWEMAGKREGIFGAGGTLDLVFSDLFPRRGRHFEMSINFNAPWQVATFSRLENMSPGEVKSFIPYLIYVDRSGTFAAGEASKIMRDRRLIELAQRSVVVKLLVHTNQLNLPKSRNVEFRWSRIPNVKVTYPSIYWTSKDIPQLKKLLNSTHYKKDAQRVLTELTNPSKEFSDFDSVLKGLNSNVAEIYNHTLILIASNSNYQQKFLQYAAQYLSEDSLAGNIERYEAVVQMLVDVGEPAFNILFETAKAQDKYPNGNRLLIDGLEKIKSKFFFSQPGTSLQLDARIDQAKGKISDLDKKISSLSKKDNEYHSLVRIKGYLIDIISELQTKKMALQRLIKELPNTVHRDLIREEHLEQVIKFGNDSFDVIYHPGVLATPVKLVDKVTDGYWDIYNFEDINGMVFSMNSLVAPPGQWRSNYDTEYIEIVPREKIEQKGSSDTSPSSSLVTDSGQRSVVSGQQFTSDKIRNASDELGGIDMNAISLDREGNGVDIQFDPVELQELIDVGIDGFAPVIINITPLPSVLPLLGLDPANKEEHLEVSSLN